MYAGPGVKTSKDFPIPDTMKAWILGNPGELKLAQKPVPVPKRAEVLVRIDAVAICATDLEIIDHGSPALIQGGKPFNKNFTPDHEYMGTVAALGPGVDEYKIGQRVTVEIHAGCGQCKRCREGMYTSCHNYGLNYGDVDNTTALTVSIMNKQYSFAKFLIDRSGKVIARFAPPTAPVSDEIVSAMETILG